MTQIEKPIFRFGDEYDGKCDITIKGLTNKEALYFETILVFRVECARFIRGKVEKAKKEGKKARLSRGERSLLRTVEQGDCITLKAPPDDPDYDVYNSE